MIIKFVSHIRKGNNKGAGFFYIPQKVRILKPATRAEIKLSNCIRYFAKVAREHDRTGIYIPTKIMRQNKLLGERVEVWIKKINGFYSKIGRDNRVYIPKEVIADQGIKHNDVVLVKALRNNKVIEEKYSKVYLLQRRRTIECFFIFDKNLCGKGFIFMIKNKTLPNWRAKFNINIIDTPLEKMTYGSVNQNLLVAFYDVKVPAIINTKFNYSHIAFYLGAYFADGTKIGNNWAICASTFEQAKYYWEIHNLLIKDSKPEFTISYTNINNTNHDEIIKKLRKEWEDKAGIRIQKFRIRKTTGTILTKWNKYGTLTIRESRQILLDFYNALLKSLIREILSKRNKKLAIDFICGVLEGDGGIPSKTHGHILIHTNKEEAHILKAILRAADIKFKLGKNGENKYFLRIGSLEILRNFHLLKDKIFKLYPKRRKNFFERFKKVGAVKFLGGNHQSTNWVKAWLRENGFADRNYKITEKGLRVRYYIQNCVTR